MATVVFTSSDGFMEDPGEPQACEYAEVEIEDYIEGTYNSLRHNKHTGAEFAWYINGAWELPDGRRFSDWAVSV